jgi:hypothetical protein
MGGSFGNRFVKAQTGDGGITCRQKRKLKTKRWANDCFHHRTKNSTCETLSVDFSEDFATINLVKITP